MTLRDALRSQLRVEALADVARRYGAIIDGLSTAVGEVIADVEPDVAARLESALRDANAQVVAVTDVLDRAIADLPEGTDPTRRGE